MTGRAVNASRAESPDGFEPVAALADIPEGELLAVRTSRGVGICLARYEGEVFAVGSTCTHQDFPMAEGHVVGGRIECVWHGAQFDLRTGDAVKLPATRPLPVFAVRVEDGIIWVGSPMEA